MKPKVTISEIICSRIPLCCTCPHCGREIPPEQIVAPDYPDDEEKWKSLEQKIISTVISSLSSTHSIDY
jgi:hypothetical protein